MLSTHVLISVDRVVIKSQRYSYTQKSYDSILCRIIKRLVLSICSLKMPRRHLASTLPALLVLVLVQASFPTLTASSSISNNLHGQHFENLFKVQGRQDLPGGCSIHFYDIRNWITFLRMTQESSLRDIPSVRNMLQKMTHRRYCISVVRDHKQAMLSFPSPCRR